MASTTTPAFSPRRMMEPLAIGPLDLGHGGLQSLLLIRGGGGRLHALFFSAILIDPFHPRGRRSRLRAHFSLKVHSALSLCGQQIQRHQLRGLNTRGSRFRQSPRLTTRVVLPRA